MPFDYLDFDYSEDDEGTGCWDAMANVTAPRVPALAAEIAQLLAWAHGGFNGRRGPVEQGGDWDYELQAQDDEGRPLGWRFEAGSLQAPAAAPGRTTVSLSLSGNRFFADALHQVFDLED
ncbi:hypothetical protein [Comamonas composti]|uniref:hypothetical protein n=1 Tax=Comamonas composti TaxID=408558 RepID=UPI00040CE1A0|nr:hypothetical protein [Comamonas composti]